MNDMNALDKLFDHLEFDSHTRKTISKNSIAKDGIIYHLDLSNLQINSLPSWAFKDLPHLTRLYLQSNELTTLSEDIFSESNLEELKIDFNKFETFPSGIFDDMENLKKLRIGSRTLSHLPDDFFNSLPQLQSLSLNNSHCTVLHSNNFTELQNLESLGLINMNIKKFPSGIFDNLLSLKNLYIQENKLEILPPNIFQQLKNLEQINLAKNSLSKLPENLFKNNSNLRVVNISKNKLTILSSGFFSKNKKLTALDLKENELKKLPLDIFVNNHCITILDLSYNEIEKLPNIGHLRNLTKLKITHNRIQELPFSLFLFPNFIRTNLIDNPESDFLNSLKTPSGVEPNDIFNWWFRKDPNMVFQKLLEYIGSNKKINHKVKWEQILDQFSDNQISHLRMAARGEFEKILTNYLFKKKV